MVGPSLWVKNVSWHSGIALRFIEVYNAPIGNIKAQPALKCWMHLRVFFWQWKVSFFFKTLIKWISSCLIRFTTGGTAEDAKEHVEVSRIRSINLKKQELYILKKKIQIGSQIGVMLIFSEFVVTKPASYQMQEADCWVHTSLRPE